MSRPALPAAPAASNRPLLPAQGSCYTSPGRTEWTLNMRRRLAIILLPLSLILAGAAAVTYFVWWDATHCTFCRERLDEFGRCPNPDCHLGQLTKELEGREA
jgi:hypothetical protein